MSAGQYDLYLEQGADWAEDFTHEQTQNPGDDPDDPATVWVPIDITDVIIRAQMRDRPGEETAYFTLTNAVGGSGAAITDAAAGKYKLWVTNEISSGLPPAPPDRFWDVYCLWPNGFEERVYQGAVTVDPTVTLPV